MKMIGNVTTRGITHFEVDQGLTSDKNSLKYNMNSAYVGTKNLYCQSDFSLPYQVATQHALARIEHHQ